MIPQDIIQRVVRAHNNAVKAAQEFAIAEADHGTSSLAKKFVAMENAEKRFEAAMAVLVDIAHR